MIWPSPPEQWPPAIVEQLSLCQCVDLSLMLLEILNGQSISSIDILNGPQEPGSMDPDLRVL